MKVHYSKILGEGEKLIFPKCNKSLQKLSKEYLLKELAKKKRQINDFKYLTTDHVNDIRDGHLQFLDDADTFLQYFEDVVVDIIEVIQYYDNIKEHAKSLNKICRQYEKRAQQYLDILAEKGIDPLAPMDSAKELEDAVNTKSYELQRRKVKLSEVEHEIAITEELLAKKKSEMELALQHRYTLTATQKQVLLEEKDKILDGIEKWGSIYGALHHDTSIKSKQSTIQMYAHAFPEFGQAIEVSKALFKDRLDGIMIERAIEGTENPVFSKGEHIGDYKIKDNKLFMELVKAKVADEYNKKAVESNKSTHIDNLNIVSFANIDETKDGFTKDVGVVIDVDDTGRVQRITQEKKLRDYYEKKEGAQIIEPEQEE